MPGGTPLIERLRSEIRELGPVTFARFMELALYDPQEGFYSRGARSLGPAGHYITASDIGRHLGRAFTRQLAEVDRSIGPLDPFHVLEFGAGRGLLARDILDAARELEPQLAGRLRYCMVERSAAMREAAARLVPEARTVDPAEIGTGHTGCVLAVELFDALPVRRLRRRAGVLMEIRVGLDAAGELIECEAPADPELHELALRYGVASQDNAEAELAPLARNVLEVMAGTLERGMLFILDYGDRCRELYGPGRPLGTLLAYRHHGAHTRYLECPGRQDLTAHVNFSLLEDHARALGLAVVGWTTQDRFLIAHGILEAFRSDTSAAWREPRRVKERLQALQLIHPEGMGRSFRVLVLAKAVVLPQPLEGLRDPFDRGS